MTVTRVTRRIKLPTDGVYLRLELRLLSVQPSTLLAAGSYILCH